MPGPIFCRTGSVLTFALLLACAALPAAAQIRFDLPPQPLSQALTKVGSLANVNIYFDALTVDGIQAPALKAELSAEEALKRLLAGTRLHIVHIDENTITVVTDTGSKNAQRAHETDTGATHQAPPVHLASAAYARPDSGGSSAESDPDASATGKPIEEVIVSAEKRDERAFDVPISLVTLSAQELKDRQVTDLDDLAFSVPGMSVQSGPNRRITLRGVSNIFGNSSLIGMYVDEADVTSVSAAQLDLNTYDMERMEVLRGPQGTLYGEGSAGGTIRFITKNPNLRAFEMNSDIAAVFSQYGAPSQRINTLLNVPLVNDQLGLRIAGTFDHEGGWIDQPAADRRNINDQNITDVRFKSLWKPLEALSVSAMAEIHRNTRSTNVGEDQDGNYTQAFGLTTTPAVVDDFNIYNATLTYDVGGARILSSSSYVSQGNDARNYNAILELAPTGTPYLNVYVGSDSKTIQIATQELRIASNSPSPWQWVAGGYFRHFLFDENETVSFGLPGPPPPALLVLNSTLANSWAAFGDTSYLFADRLTLGAGLRYFDEDQAHNNGLGTPRQTGKFHSLNPRGYAQLKLTDQLNLHASAAKGFRSGGFNSQSQPAFDPESVWTYELGLKALLFDNRFSADVAVFHSDYTNYQVVGIPPPPAPPVQTTSNAGKARIDGVEWGLNWRALDEWTLGLSGDWLKSKFTQINATATAYQIGDPLDLFPKYEVVATVQRDFQIEGRRGFARLDYSQQGRETYRDRTLGSWYFSQSDVIRMLNFNTGLHWSENLTLGLFAKNLLNTRAFTDPFEIEHTAARARPRTIGFEFGIAF